MRRILFVNACIRGEQSRTLRLARGFLRRFGESHGDFEVETADLNALRLMPLYEDTLNARNAAGDHFEDAQFDLARQFKAADLLVIAAPFWEGTFPAALHTYLERVCVTGFTFSCGEHGYTGHCRAQEAVFITTRGGIYEEGEAVRDNHAYGFLRTVLGMLGVRTLHTVAAEGLDIEGADVETILAKAEKRLETLAGEI